MRRILSLVLVMLATLETHAQGLGPPTAVLFPAPTIEFPAPIDSNSPAFWDIRDGRRTLFLFTSVGHPQISGGSSVRRLTSPAAVHFDKDIRGGIWLEAVVQDDRGVLYGYYHNEPRGVCPDESKTAPRLGAARSVDGGWTWEDLGAIMESPLAPMDCDAPNKYFAGGVGDFSVALSPNATDLYFFFSAYPLDPLRQGVVVGRMLWAERDRPRGQIAVWADSIWQYPQFAENPDTGSIEMELPEGSPLFETTVSWYDRSGSVDAFWGPSVHWNTHLKQYVMLLNRAADSEWSQEGIYVSFNPVLDDPTQWTVPQKIYDGGAWYPQVIGLEPGIGTDKVAGAEARFFVGGRSDYTIRFFPATH